MKLSKKSLLVVSVMLFALFFGAGNLIFPPFLGQNAGENTLPAMIGFLATAVVLPVLGVVENFSYLVCPDCGKKISVFGESHVDEVANELAIPVLAKLPIEPEKAKAADAGEFYQADSKEFETAVEVLKNI